MLVPGLDEFLSKTSGGRRMPVYLDILADLETPLSAYWKLASSETYSFLLESVTGGEQLARYSILGVRPRVVLRSKGDEVRRIDEDGNETRRELHPRKGSGAADETANTVLSDPLDALVGEMPEIPVHVDGLPKFIGGAVGMLAYDYVRFLEKLPDAPVDDLGIDDMAMMVCDTVVVFDHARNLLRVISLAEGSQEGYERARLEIERVSRILSKPLPPLPQVPSHMRTDDPAARHRAVERDAVESSMTRSGFESAVRRAIEYIAEGDCIQVVLSQRFSAPFAGHPLALYRALRSLNPSPYMFLLRFGDMDIVGASPELLVSLEGTTGRVRPIAGTRWRGATKEEDELLGEELLADEKERAEHIMLVDLGRNDLGRVADYGSVKVNELMVIERYSHVMHIVSDVTGSIGFGGQRSGFQGGESEPRTQNPGPRTSFPLLRACFPAGTVSGAPKVRAMQIIDELEPTQRGVYAGAIGYFSATGDMDTAIAIRTIVLKGGRAHVQAGAGIVYDSIPEREYEETMNKARASLRAIELAKDGLA